MLHGHINKMGTKIYNSILTKELIEGAKIQSSTDSIPSELAEKVIPVMEVNPKILARANIVKYGSRGTTGSSAVYTTPTDRDFILTGFTLNGAADASADNTSFALLITPEGGVSITLAELRKITLTAYSGCITRSFTTPIKIARGSAITISTTFSVGSSAIAASIEGYTIENINA